MNVLRNMREVQLKGMKQELVSMLQAKQEPSAHLKVEQIHREQNIMAAYEILKLLCEQIADRLPIIQAQKQCPIELREAVASIIYAAPRCSDIRELQQIRKLLSAKYGKEFTAIAAELRPDCGVNREVVQKLSVSRPPIEVKLKLMKAIAVEHHLEWDPTDLESQILTCGEDLLDEMDIRPSVQPITEVEHLTSDNQSSSQVLKNPPRQGTSDGPSISRSSSCVSTPGKQGSSSYRASPVSSVASCQYDEDENAQDASETRQRIQDVISVAHKAADSAERAAAATRAALEIVEQNFEETSSISDSETDSYGSDSSQVQAKLESSHVKPRRSSHFDEVEDEKALFRKQDSWRHHMRQGGSRGHAASQCMSGMGQYDEHSNGSSSERTRLDTLRPFPNVDTSGRDDSNSQRAEEAAPSIIPQGLPTRALPELPETQIPSLARATSFPHPKLPDSDELFAHFEALKGTEK